MSDSSVLEKLKQAAARYNQKKRSCSSLIGLSQDSVVSIASTQPVPSTCISSVPCTQASVSQHQLVQTIGVGLIDRGVGETVQVGNMQIESTIISEYYSSCVVCPMSVQTDVDTASVDVRGLDEKIEFLTSTLTDWITDCRLEKSKGNLSHEEFDEAMVMDLLNADDDTDVIQAFIEDHELDVVLLETLEVGVSECSTKPKPVPTTDNQRKECVVRKSLRIATKSPAKKKLRVEPRETEVISLLTNDDIYDKFIPSQSLLRRIKSIARPPLISM